MTMGEDLTGCEAVVQHWLRSIGHAQYLHAFLDNGYDDIEVCKQIGYADLDAIGVEQLEHRIAIFTAVEALRKAKGPSRPFYFQLENPNSPSKFNGNNTTTTSYNLISNSNAIESRVMLNSPSLTTQYNNHTNPKALAKIPTSVFYSSSSASSGLSSNVSGSEGSSLDMLAVLEDADFSSDDCDVTEQVAAKTDPRLNFKAELTNLDKLHSDNPKHTLETIQVNANGTNFKRAPTLDKSLCHKTKHTLDKLQSGGANVLCHTAMIHSPEDDETTSDSKKDSERTESFELEDVDSKENSGFSSLCSGKSSKCSPDEEKLPSSSEANSSVSIEASHPGNQAKAMDTNIRSSVSLKDMELLEVRCRRAVQASTSFSGGHVPRRRAGGWRPLSLAEPGTSGVSMMSAYGHSNRSVPPPLPPNPPIGNYSDSSDVESTDIRTGPEIECLTDSSDKPRPSAHPSQAPPTRHTSLRERLTGQDHKRLRSLTRLFSFRKSQRRVRYKSPSGGLDAKDITMSDDDRIRLLIMVKEGRISMDEAINTVKRYENEKKSGVNRNLNEYIPQDAVQIPVASEKTSKLSPLKFLRSFSFIKGSKRKKFLRDLEYYYKEQEKRQKSLHDPAPCVKPEDGGNYSQPTCCTSNQCNGIIMTSSFAPGTSEARQICANCTLQRQNRGGSAAAASSHGNTNTASSMNTAENNTSQYFHQFRDTSSPSGHVNFDSFHQRVPVPHQYGNHGVHFGLEPLHPSDPRLHNMRTHIMQHPHNPDMCTCAQCSHLKSAHTHHQFHRSNTQPMQPHPANSYFQRDLTRHSFHSVPVRGQYREQVPYFHQHQVGYDSYNASHVGHPAFDIHGYPAYLPRDYQRNAMNPSPFHANHPNHHPQNLMQHTILEERSPNPSQRSSMENVNSPAHIPRQPRTNPKRSLSERICDDVSNNNPGYRERRRQATPLNHHHSNNSKVSIQVHNHSESNSSLNNGDFSNNDVTGSLKRRSLCHKHARQRKLSHRYSSSSGDITTNNIPTTTNTAIIAQNTQISPSSRHITTEDENANESVTSSLEGESGCGASIRSGSQQENYAQTCRVNPASSLTTVEDLCDKLGLEHLQDTFLSNGFETLELFKQLEEDDLSTLGITSATDRAKVLTAVTLLPDDHMPPYDAFTYRKATDVYATINKRKPSHPLNRIRASSLSASETCASNPELSVQITHQQIRDSGCYSGVDHSNANVALSNATTAHSNANTDATKEA